MKLNTKDDLYTLFKHNPSIVTLSDHLTKKFVDVNEAFVKQLGYSKHDVIGKTSLELGLIVDSPKQHMLYKEIEARGSINHVELEVRKKNGGTLRGLFFSELIDYHGSRTLLTIMVDVTKQFELEKTQKKMLSLLNSTLEATADGIVVVDLKGKLTLYNQKFLDIWHISKSQINSNEVTSIIGHVAGQVKDEKCFYQSLKRYQLDSNLTEKSLYELKDGRVIERYTQPQKNEESIVGRVWSFRDITEAKAAEQELKMKNIALKEAIQAKSQFLANMSHEIRTPMNGILGFIELLNETPLNDEQKDYVNEAKNATHILLQLVNDILDYSKIEASKMKVDLKPTAIKSLIESSIQLYQIKARSKNTSIVLEIGPDVPHVIATDAFRLSQIINNLLNNAVKFTENGQIHFEVKYMEKEKHMDLIVRDTGIGIDRDHLKNLFSVFHQADTTSKKKYEGTGLGLAISQELAHLLGGEIKVESQLGQGSSFLLRLPCIPLEASEPLDQDNSQQEVTQKIPQNIRVLVAEDNRVNQKLIEKVLSKNGLKSTVVQNGIEALEALHHDLYDIVIMDCQMPLMDGYECTREIRKRFAFSHYPYIIAMTANALKGDREKCIDAGMNDYLAKPFEFKNFQSLLASSHQLNLLEKSEYFFMKETGMDKEDARDFMSDFIMVLEESILALKERSVNSVETVEAIAHRLKGSALSMRCAPVAEIAKRLEANEKSGEKNDEEKWIQSLIEVYNELKEQIGG